MTLDLDYQPICLLSLPGGSDNISPICQITEPNSNIIFNTTPISIGVSANDLSNIWQVEYQYSVNHSIWYSFPSEYIENADRPKTDFSIYSLGNEYQIE